MRKYFKGIPGFLIFIMVHTLASAQTGEVRGFVYDKLTAAPVEFASVFIVETRQGGLTNDEGFYAISGIKVGKYHIMVQMPGYDSAVMEIEIKRNSVSKQNFYLNPTAELFEEVKVTAKRQRQLTDPRISTITITPKELERLPTVGGEPDVIQYLQVLPGVVVSGDQGGQLYIRGGSPVMNKVLLDGMTIYNPFHSIGLFSVFDADIIKSVDVQSAAFGAEYGDRISAIIDVQTRDGNRNNLAGKFRASPFSSKLLLEGPLKKFKANQSSSSFILSYKNSYLDRSSKLFYNYVGENKLPYSFQDLFAKASFVSDKGSYIKMDYFNYNDQVDFKNIASYNWNSTGLGGKFLLTPYGSKTLIDGYFAYSDYQIKQQEADNKPRRSGINGFNLGLNFNYYIKQDELKYGLEINGFRTEFEIYNAANRRIDQFENTTEIGGFITYKKIWKKRLIFKPGFRIQHYASLANTSLEPRLSMKYLLTSKIRLKMAAGLYSQNLLSAVSDRDVVNLFYGFLSGPDDLPEVVNGKKITYRMQTARHAVAGVEVDVAKNQQVISEVYVKDFTQITNINRDKIYDDNLANQNKPYYLRKDFIVETGLAYGFDVTYSLESKRAYLWFVYSYNKVTRNDGIRKYWPHFDRRHNLNLVGTYAFGKELNTELNVRWNFGSGFPFTLTQGFYENIDFSQGQSTNYTQANGDFSIVYDNLNRGRLPYYHRLDISVKHHIPLLKKGLIEKRAMDITLSVTNVYNRENIFYFNRVSYQRVNQLPILPSLAFSYKF